MCTPHYNSNGLNIHVMWSFVGAAVMHGVALVLHWCCTGVALVLQCYIGAWCYNRALVYGAAPVHGTAVVHWCMVHQWCTGAYASVVDGAALLHGADWRCTGA